jgi:site-specific DNA-methyltransferase (adenine-specific)
VGEPFDVLEADPAWLFGDGLPGAARGASKHYRCLTRRELMRFEIPTMAASSVLFLWRVSAMPQEALDVIDAWGFEPKAEIVWSKSTKRGLQHFGMGHYVRNAHEVCIVATRGRWRPTNRSTRSVFTAPVGRHSEKPEAFYELVEGMTEGMTRARLFARSQRPGWTSYGDQCPSQEGDPEQ